MESCKTILPNEFRLIWLLVESSKMVNSFRGRRYIIALLYVVSQANEQENVYLIGNNDIISVHRIAEIAIEQSKYNIKILFDNTTNMVR